MSAYKDTERGSWYVSFHYNDWTGKNRRKMKRGFKTKKEATDFEHHFKLEQASNLDMTFGDFWEVYTENVKPKIRYNTWCTKEHIVRTKILPYFEDKKMRDIKARDIIQWQNQMRSLTYDDDEKEYAGTYLKTLQSQLSAIFNHAVSFYELRSNPVRQAGSLGSGQADEMLFWTKDEYLKFIPEVANKPVSYYAFELLYWCGIRLGELRALTPADFSFEDNTIHITKSYQRIKGEDIITKPKTKKSIRNVVMPKPVALEIQDYIASLYKVKKTDRLFPVSKSYMHHEMDRGVKASGVKRIRIHDLRHSHVAYLISLGFSPLEIGRRIGHSSEKITEQYSHLYPSQQLALIGKMDEDYNNSGKENHNVSERE